MRIRSFTDSAYVAAFRDLAKRVEESLTGVPERVLPIRMYVAGGAALHFYTGARVSIDVDATFSHRIALPDNLEIAYKDAGDSARLLYFDRQYNDSFGLLHESAYDDSVHLSLPGINSKTLDIRLLSPLDLAVSKLARFAEQDRQDILALAKRGLVNAATLRARADAALARISQRADWREQFLYEESRA